MNKIHNKMDEIPDIKLSDDINIELGNKCLLSCFSCCRNEKEYFKGTYNIPFSEAEPIFDAFGEISLVGNMSDPIYHSDFIKTLKKLSYMNKRTLINTNGSGKTREFWIEAFELTKNKNITWRFSLDGLPKNSYIYREKQDGHEILEIMKLGSSMGCKIEWQYIIFNYNQNDIEQAKLIAEKYNFEFRLIKSNKFYTNDDVERAILKHGEDSRKVKQIKKLQTLQPEQQEMFAENPHYIDKSENEFIPQCLLKKNRKALFFENKGFIVPCCETPFHQKEFEMLGLYDEEFHISNLKDEEDVRNVLKSEQWTDFFNILINEPENAPSICKQFCSKPKSYYKDFEKGIRSD
jgi:hypothetical protein